MPILANRARMTTATTGTGTLTLGSAVDGYQTFADAGITDGNSIRYVIEDGSNWEIGEGTYTASGTTLTRTVIESNNSDAAINLSGSAEVFIDATAEDLTLDVQEFTSSGTWTKPKNGTYALIELWGGGGGGGGASSPTRSGGGGGGGGYYRATVRFSDLGASESVTIGAGGSGGAVQTNGAAGGDTTFAISALSLTLTAGGGGGGEGSGVADGGAGGDSGISGIIDSGNLYGITTSIAENNGADGIPGIYAGGGGGAGSSSSSGGAGGVSVWGGGGGGAGGDGSGSPGTAGAGGGGSDAPNGGAAGTSGASPTAGSAGAIPGGGGGGGGGSTGANTGGAGGDGALPGGGGGGGGASASGTGGDGGAGADGKLRVTVV